MSDSVTDLLGAWLHRQVPEPRYAWLEGELARLSQGRLRDLEVVFGLAPRRLGRADLELTAEDLARAAAARPGWDPRGWTIPDAARVLALLRFSQGASDFASAVTELCRTADVGEAVALYRGLPLYPRPEAFDWQVGEGLRTSMQAVFEAIAHRSPYPMENFVEERWNHMVLKALFVGSALAPIQGLDQRSNPTLARILSDYAHERWAAGRPVTPELWRCMGPFAAGELVDDLARLADSSDAGDRRAAALALSAGADVRASEVLRRIPVEALMVKTGSLSWDSLSA